MLSVDDRRGHFDIPRPFNLARHVLWDNDAEADKIALTVLKASGSERWSYGRLREAVLATGAALRAAGLRPGERLLLRLGNTADFPIAYLGAIAAGIVPVPTSAALGEAEITRIAGVLRPAAVLAASDVAVPAGYTTLTMAGLPRVPALDAPLETDPETPAYIVFTSGTASDPVGVVHAHRAILARRFMFEGWYGLGAGDRVLHAGAFNWTYTLGTGLMDPWTMGASALIPAPGVGTELLALLLRRHEATILAGAPGIFRQILRQAPLSLPHLRHGLSAGEKLAEPLRQAWRRETGTEIHEAFGQSECSTFISGAPARPAPPGTLGHVQEGRAIALLGPEGPVPRGEIGEIAVADTDPGLMLSYLGQARPTAPPGWFPTGDLGMMNADGSVSYIGRKDDVLTAGGFRLSPVEIEEAMRLCPGVLDAAAVDHEITPGTTVVALHYAADAPLPEAALKAHAEAHLARHKQPRLFLHHGSLPRNANGKLLRRRLRPANEAPS